MQPQPGLVAKLYDSAEKAGAGHARKHRLLAHRGSTVHAPADDWRARYGVVERASTGYLALAFAALTRAQRALVAAMMLARPAALSFRFGLADAVALAG